MITHVLGKGPPYKCSKPSYLACFEIAAFDRATAHLRARHARVCMHLPCDAGFAKHGSTPNLCSHFPCCGLVTPFSLPSTLPWNLPDGSWKMIFLSQFKGILWWVPLQSGHEGTYPWQLWHLQSTWRIRKKPPHTHTHKRF